MFGGKWWAPGRRMGDAADESFSTPHFLLSPLKAASTSGASGAPRESEAAARATFVHKGEPDEFAAARRDALRERVRASGREDGFRPVMGVEVLRSAARPPSVLPEESRF